MVLREDDCSEAVAPENDEDDDDEDGTECIALVLESWWAMRPLPATALLRRSFL